MEKCDSQSASLYRRNDGCGNEVDSDVVVARLQRKLMMTRCTMGTRTRPHAKLRAWTYVLETASYVFIGADYSLHFFNCASRLDSHAAFHSLSAKFVMSGSL